VRSTAPVIPASSGTSPSRSFQPIPPALASFAKALELSPQRGGVHYRMSVALLQNGDTRGASQEIDRETDDVWKMIGRPAVYCALGQQADANAALDSLIAAFEHDAPSNIAANYALCGNTERAFAWLDKAVAYRDPGVYEIGDTMFANLRDDPRWLPFLQRSAGHRSS
jgi:tetratricopeptide (TPR) repeat protein